jgi:predicted DNA-binding protein
MTKKTKIEAAAQAEKAKALEQKMFKLKERPAHIPVRVPHETKERLEAIALAEQRPLAKLCRDLLETYLDQFEPVEIYRLVRRMNADKKKGK